MTKPHHIKIQQEVFDTCSQYMMGLLETIPTPVLTHRLKERLPSYHSVRIRSTSHEDIVTPTLALLSSVGEEGLEECIRSNNYLVLDAITSINTLGKLPYAREVDKMDFNEDAYCVRSILLDIENVFCTLPVQGWAQMLVNVAKKYFIRWDRDYIAKNLVDPASKPSEKEELSAQQLLEVIQNRRKELTDEQKEYLNTDHLPDIMNKFVTPEVRSLECRPEDEQPATITFSQPFGQHVMIGKWYTFVTETSPAHLVYGQLTQVDVRYTLDNPEGKSTLVFEAKEQTFRKEPELHSIHNFGNVITEGDSIHFTKFSEIVKKMINRLS